MDIGTLLRYYRKNRLLTQEKVAEAAGINEKYYGRIERNESIPTVDKFFSLCKAMKAEPAQLCYALTGKTQFEYLLIDRKNEPFYVERQTNMHMITNPDVIDNLFEELYYVGALKGYTIYGSEIQKTISEPHGCTFRFPQENLIVQNNVVLCEKEPVMYPAGDGGAVRGQLEFLCEKLQENYKVNYNIFILRLNIHSLFWSDEIADVMNQAQSSGMRIMPYYLYYENGVLTAQALKLKIHEKNMYKIVFDNTR
ncbi:MAG: helix-turn-helix domain-containing protein [Lachnospiraceae bacterium]|nr:helix-turn-helix domain-containing protein [Lachnospiraceae bacterium]